MALATIEIMVRRVVFNKDSFYILSATEMYQFGKPFTVKGNLIGVHKVSVDTPIAVTGTWGEDPKYGKQFNIKAWSFPKGLSEEHKVTMCENLLGFDRDTTRALIVAHGPQALSVLEGNLEEIKVPLTQALKECAIKWKVLKRTRAAAALLADMGLSTSEANRAFTLFGDDAIEIIKNDPYRLMEIQGFSLSNVYMIAQKQGVHDQVSFTGAVLLHALATNLLEGHVCMPAKSGYDMVQSVKIELLNEKIQQITLGMVEKAWERLTQQKAVVKEFDHYYLPDYYLYEADASKLLQAHRSHSQSKVRLELDQFIGNFELTSGMILSKEQRSAVQSLMEDNVLVLTGLPGTGKTTAVRALVRLFDVAQLSYALLAPTGIAAKRLAHVTSKQAYTIHKYLQYNGVEWGHNSDNRALVDVVIVDEFSMVDMELFYRILSALPPETMLVFVGDSAQLPSVGAGNVLAELSSSGVIPHVQLTQIYRQSAEGDIVSNAHKINRGDIPVMTMAPESEFKFIPSTSYSASMAAICKIARHLKDKESSFQVLSSRYEGELGVDALNNQLQTTLNPSGPPEIFIESTNVAYRLGDRVMVLRNDYKREVCNGDVGKIVSLTPKSIQVKIHNSLVDKEVTYKREELGSHLQLAYAISVHKSQGSEYDTVIIPVVQEQGRMLQRNLLYTAVTRAKKRVILIGDVSAVIKSVSTAIVQSRNTNLRNRVVREFESGS